ncbi:15591_t:CDS:2, partial [Entrophospora sp. SA101]
NSHILEQAEISREEEVGTIIGQKQSYEKDLPSISLGKMEMIPQTIMQSNSKDDDLFLDDEINDVSAEVQQFIVKMKRVEHCLFDYHIINLSERNQMDPVNKIFTDDERIQMQLNLHIEKVESTLRKQHRNETKGRKPRVNVGTNHDGILKICMNAKEIEVGFLEVVVNALLVDVIKYHDDMDKFLKGGWYIVDIFTSFIIPDNVGQAYVLAEIMEKVYFFKNYTPSNETPVTASSSKRATAKY